MGRVYHTSKIQNASFQFKSSHHACFCDADPVPVGRDFAKEILRIIKSGAYNFILTSVHPPSRFDKARNSVIFAVHQLKGFHFSEGSLHRKSTYRS
jgi:hypothetical protein